MSKDDKTLLIGAVLIFTVILAAIIGWPSLIFSGFAIACITFAKTKD